MFKKVLMPGDRFGRLTITGKRERRKWGFYELCLCDCGKEKWVSRHNLFGGITKSCGCINVERGKRGLFSRHGMHDTRIYGIYCGAKNRCENKSQINYKYYGGKGVKFLRNNFEEFYNDMGESYNEHVRKFGEKNTTLDRINPNGDYSKENCRWATIKEQANNSTRCRRVVYNGKEYSSISELGRDIGLSYSGARARIKKQIAFNH